MGGGGGCGRASSALRKVARKLIVMPCGLFSSSASVADSSVAAAAATAAGTSTPIAKSQMFLSNQENVSEIMEEAEFPATISPKNLCTICLEPLLNNNGTTSPGYAVFTAQCSHAFHLSCISSNIRHGSMTCPICRAHWTQLPRSLHPPSWLPRNPDDPILRILDHSITTFRVHRRSFLRSARYDDDDPTEPDQAHSLCQPRISFSLIPLSAPETEQHPYLGPYMHHSPLHFTESLPQHPRCCYLTREASCLSIKVAPQEAIDLVLVASPDGSHLRLLKQAMALAVFALRPIDRLAIVSYSSAAARVFPLRRMTTYGKRAALQVIDRLFYTGHADLIEGIKKGIKILKDRVHMNPHCSILHLSDNPARIRGPFHMEMPIPVHQFHVSSSCSILHEVEAFLDELIGGGIRETQLRIGDGEEAKIVRLGELRCEEERRIPLDMDECCSHICVGYSYVENGVGIDSDERIRTGEVVVTSADGRQAHGLAVGANTQTVTRGRTSSVESWDYHDPYMARRWAKRLHGGQRF